MMKKSILPLLAMLAMSDPSFPVVGPRHRPERRRRGNVAGEGGVIHTPPKATHSFTIHGQVIEATDKKTAKKIYALRNKTK